MPIKHGYSKKSISKNIETEMAAGKPHEQSIAIALEEARQAKAEHKSYVGMINPESIIKAIKMKKQHLAHGGEVQSEDEEFLSADMESPEEEMHEDPIESQEELKKRILLKAMKRD